MAKALVLNATYEPLCVVPVRRAVVLVLKTIMEGAGAIIAYGANGDITQGCIDVGGRTTDLFVAEGQVPILHQCSRICRSRSLRNVAPAGSQVSRCCSS